jgi:hypothetical protein
MKIHKRRDFKKAVSDALKNGDLTITCSNGKTNDPAICDVCKKLINDVLDSYAYQCINDDNYVDVEEKCFCTKKCQNEYLKREVGKIN